MLQLPVTNDESYYSHGSIQDHRRVDLFRAVNRNAVV